MNISLDNTNHIEAGDSDVLSSDLISSTSIFTVKYMRREVSLRHPLHESGQFDTHSESVNRRELIGHRSRGGQQDYAFSPLVHPSGSAPALGTWCEGTLEAAGVLKVDDVRYLFVLLPALCTV